MNKSNDLLTIYSILDVDDSCWENQFQHQTEEWSNIGQLQELGEFLLSKLLTLRNTYHWSQHPESDGYQKPPIMPWNAQLCFVCYNPLWRPTSPQSCFLLGGIQPMCTCCALSEIQTQNTLMPPMQLNQDFSWPPCTLGGQSQCQWMHWNRENQERGYISPNNALLVEGARACPPQGIMILTVVMYQVVLLRCQSAGSQMLQCLHDLSTEPPEDVLLGLLKMLMRNCWTQMYLIQGLVW